MNSQTSPNEPQRTILCAESSHREEDRWKTYVELIPSRSESLSEMNTMPRVLLQSLEGDANTDPACPNYVAGQPTAL